MLIDDHPMLNYGLAACLEETGRFSISAQATSLSEAQCIIKDAKTLPSLIILDILLGEENGLDFLSFLDDFCRTSLQTKPPVLVCSVLEDPFRIRSALSLGASGYIPKTGTKTELISAIDTVLQGGLFVPDEYTGALHEASSIHARFTKREITVLNLIKQNKTNQQIAQNLNISLRTVENYISNIYFKTGAENRLELLKL